MPHCSTVCVQAAETKQEGKTVENRITQGVIWKQILLFFFPIWFGTFFQQLYNTADAVIVGNFVGKEALAAVGGTAVILNLLVGFFVGIASGASVIISQRFGSGDRQGVSRAVHTAVALAIAGGAVIMILGILSTNWSLQLINTPADILEESRLYLQVCYLGMIPSILYNMGTGILRAVGDSRRPLYFLIAASITNIVLDLLFVVVLDMKVLGVALGTVISQVVAAALTMLSLTHTEECYKFNWRAMRFDGHILAQIVRIGLPAGLQSVMYSLSNLVVQGSINAFGTDVVAAYTAYGKIDSVFWMSMNSFGLSITTFVGQNFGAHKYDRVKKSIWQCIGLAFAATAILLGLIMPFGPILYRFFVQDAQVIELGMDILYYLGPVWPTYVLIEVLSGGVRGTGDSVLPMIMTCFGVCVLRVVWILGIATPFWHTLHGVLVCYPISWSLTSLLFLIYFLQGGWLRRRIRVQQAADEKRQQTEQTV